jgi:Tfp pilus assembly protein PilV
MNVPHRPDIGVLVRHWSLIDRSPSGVARRGVTLSEVLVSLLVMSVGVVAIATLFPLSVLRTVQATQLTNSTQLRYNFEGLLGARPELLAGAASWEPSRAYQAGDLVTSRVGGSTFYECTVAGTSAPFEPGWNSQVGANTTDGTATWVARRSRVYMVDPVGWEERTNELTAAPGIRTVNVRNTFGRDRIDGSSLPALDSPYSIVRFRGGRSLSAPTLLNPNPSSSVYFPGRGTAQEFASLVGARQSAMLPDNWVFQSEVTDIAGITTTSLETIGGSTQLVPTLDANGDNDVDLRFVALPDGEERRISARVLMFDVTGQIAFARTLVQITVPAVGRERLVWDANEPLPAGFTPAKIRVETQDERFSWMLAVRRQTSGAAYMNLVTFFRRSTDPEDELIHRAHFYTGSFSSQGGGWPGADGIPGNVDDVADIGPDLITGAPQVTRVSGTDGTLGTADDVAPKAFLIVEYHPDLGAAAPFLKRGGFICDAQNNRWYRVESYTEVNDAVAFQQALDGSFPAALMYGGRPGAIVRLASPPLGSSGRYGSRNAAGFNGDALTPAMPGGAILMRGIVDVYPLQPVLPWEN